MYVWTMRFLAWFRDPLGIKVLRAKVEALEAERRPVEVLAREFFSRLPPRADANNPSMVDFDWMTKESFRLARNWFAASEGREMEPRP